MDNQTKNLAESVNYFILKSLESNEKYGYEIIDSISAISSNKVQIKQATLYTNLKKLEQKGLINSYWKDSEIGGKRHYYYITEKGLKHLNDYDSNLSKDEPNNDEKNNLGTSQSDIESSNVEIIDNSLDNNKTQTKAYWSENKYFASKMLDSNLNNPIEDLMTNKKSENKQQEQNNDYTNVDSSNSFHIKPDASVLKDDEVIPFNYEAISMENRPINNASITETDIDYKSILGELYIKKTPIVDAPSSSNNNSVVVKNEEEVRNKEGEFENSVASENTRYSTVNKSNTPNILPNKETNFNNYKIKVKQHNKLFKVNISDNDFIKVNKLNLIISLITFGLFNVLLLISSLVSSNFGTQSNMLPLIVFLISMTYPTAMFIIYSLNKNKKSRNQYNYMYSLLINILISLVAIIFVISICLLCGMTNLNQEKYIFYWVITIILCVAIISHPIIKNLLIKSNKFNC